MKWVLCIIVTGGLYAETCYKHKHFPSNQRFFWRQLQNANLTQYFDKILSADTIKRLKPAKEVYEMAARSFEVDVQEIRLVAAHAWDIAGALRAGCKAAFVARPGMVLDPLVEKPDVVGRDLKEVVDQILESAG
ncbi:MAG TPA: HAD-IA family hydrolase [Candidatus Limnocylindria bacterium]|nr:HAD-IA family hydrolase [Candidatus Limnocylindria bacterium]